jgi:formylglycine-generating enzyme required for sulfatase activity
MMGNVREWCLDWYDARAYETPHAQGPSGPPKGLLRTIRGACFIDKTPMMRSSTRGYREPDEAFNNQGFRVVWMD